MVHHYYTRKDTMTSFTWNAVCEHTLLIMQNMPYGLFSMQQGSFELSDSQTRVLHNNNNNNNNNLYFFFTYKLCSHEVRYEKNFPCVKFSCPYVNFLNEVQVKHLKVIIFQSNPQLFFPVYYFTSLFSYFFLFMCISWNQSGSKCPFTFTTIN